MAVSDKNSVLDPTLLKCLAMTAAAHKRSIEDELNVAVRAYVLNEFDEHGVDELAERAFSDHSKAATK